MSLRTPLCDLLGIDVPIICAPFGPWEQVELAAAVSNAGGLGSLGTAVRGLDDLRKQWRRMRELTDRPFAINHTRRPFDPEAFAATLEERPAVISFHIGDPLDLVTRAHDAGIRWIQQVGDIDQARTAVERGVDVIVAQGGEAGGNAGDVATLVLVPQIVDIAGQIPVVAAGGIANGRGLAAALALGAQGVVLGTRFLASTEMRIAQEWKDAIVQADARDAVKIDFANAVMPPFSEGAYTTMTPRVLRNAFVEQWMGNAEGAAAEAERLRGEILAAVRSDRLHEYLPFTGQSVALIHEVLPAAEIMTRTVAEAEEALKRASRCFSAEQH
ncbi:NAD(P)H-dependent flavin oxidoreductase [Kallotenue papyrolyticum]|uniref:NAD(P)H-dependent flavin oxidoreductase n=1 Tax=Kallotenue papyrolyticum TaxID=1325125 RepID=UPI0004926160|nr:nitronate monooxygenase [Kallotenue papyrolyticum]